MTRRERIRPSAGRVAEPADGDGHPDPLPRRPIADTRRAAQLLERIRRLLSENRPR